MGRSAAFVVHPLVQMSGVAQTVGGRNKGTCMCSCKCVSHCSRNNSRTPVVHFEHWFQVTYPPVAQRTAWTQPLALVPEVPSPQVVYQSTDTLPALSSVVKSTTAAWGQQQQTPPSHVGANPLPRPPPAAAATIRSRPLSAGSATLASRRLQTGASSSPPVQHRGQFRDCGCSSFVVVFFEDNLGNSSNEVRKSH